MPFLALHVGGAGLVWTEKSQLPNLEGLSCNVDYGAMGGAECQDMLRGGAGGARWHGGVSDGGVLCCEIELYLRSEKFTYFGSNTTVAMPVMEMSFISWSVISYIEWSL